MRPLGVTSAQGGAHFGGRAGSERSRGPVRIYGRSRRNDANFRSVGCSELSVDTWGVHCPPLRKERSEYVGSSWHPKERARWRVRREREI